jgi:hypothetical protein
MRTSTRVALGLVLPLLVPSLAHAQAFPTLSATAPQGGQRGTTVSIAFTGDRLAGASALVFDGSGLSATITGHTGQKMATFSGAGVSGDIPDAGRLAAEIAIAEDAAVGVRFVRVSTPEGVSNALPFVVGDFPEVPETEPNNAADAAQEVWLPVTVTGTVTSVDDEDYYHFAATAGQRILCAAATTQTGSPLDAYLRLLDPDGKEVSTPGAGSSSIDHTITVDGTYTLAIRDRRYQGSGRHTYRLSVGATPLLDEVFPLGGRRGVDGSVSVVGRNLGGISSIRVAVAPDAALGVRELRVTTEDGWTTNALPFAIGDLPEITEAEPNGADDEADDIPTPVTINGRIGEDGDTDSITFAVEAGQQLAMEVYAGRLGSKLDALLTLTRAPSMAGSEEHPTDADTSEHPTKHPTGHPADATPSETDDSAPLAVNDDARGADPRIDYTFTDAGRYTVTVRDLNGHGGSNFAYRLSVSPLQPDFSVAVNPAEGARPDVPTRGVARIAAGGSTPLAVDVSRVDGFAGAVRFRCENLPEGFSVDSALVEAGQTRGYITLTAPWDAAPALHPVSIVGVAAVGGQRVERVASPNRVLLTVTPACPFTLSVAEAAITVEQGKDATLHVEGVRADGFSAPVALSVIGLPGLARASGASLAASDDAAVIPLHAWTVPSRNPVVAVPRAGVQYVTVKGSATIDGKPVAAYSRAVPLTIVESPFIVNVEPIRQSFLLPAVETATSADSTEGSETAANADEGMDADFAVEITRQGGFTDTASVAVTGLPEGLTASVATVPEHENSVTITLTASRSLETGEYPIRFTGKATVNGREFSQDSQSVVIKILR